MLRMVGVQAVLQMTSLKIIRVHSCSFVVLLFVTLANAESWKTITPGWKPNRIATTLDAAWAASEGGLLRVKPSTRQMEVWNKDQGLFTNYVTVVRTEPGGVILWVGYNNGGLDRLDSRTGRVIQRIRDFYNDPDIFTINDIDFGDNAAFIATEIGVSRMEPTEDPNIWIVRESYKHFRDWEIGVISIGLNDDYLFIGTTRGVARGELNANLIQPSNWTLFPFRDAFPDTLTESANRINFLEEIDGRLYAGLRRKAVYRYENDTFRRVGNLCVPFGISADLDGRIIIGDWDGLSRLSNSETAWERILDLGVTVNDVTVAFGQIWCTVETDAQRSESPGGIGRYNGDELELLSPNTPGGNFVFQIDVSPSGTVWIAAGLMFNQSIQMRGVYSYENGLWSGYSPLNFIDYPFFNSILGIGFDAQGWLWIGTHGKGALRIDPKTGAYNYFNSHDSTGARVGGIEDDPNYPLIGDFTVEPEGGLWITNPENLNDEPLIYIPAAWFSDPSVDWIYYGVRQGIDNRYISLVERDNLGRLWLAPISYTGANRPLILLDPHGTPEDPDDDVVYYFTKDSNNLGFSTLHDMKYAGGLIWFGGPDSLYFIDTDQTYYPYNNATLIPVSLPLGSQVLALEIDPVGNIWVGTDFGVFAYNPDRQRWIHRYTPENGQYPSPLVSEHISALCLNPRTGELYIGTEDGISVLSTPYRNLTLSSDNQHGQLVLKPNPFFIGPDQTQRLVFWGENERKVRILTPSGRLVRSLNQSEAAYGWDGKTKDGDWAATGIYLVVAIDNDGIAEVGKVAVIRK